MQLSSAAEAEAEFERATQAQGQWLCSSELEGNANRPSVSTVTADVLHNAGAAVNFAVQVTSFPFGKTEEPQGGENFWHKCLTLRHQKTVQKCNFKEGRAVQHPLLSIHLSAPPALL